MNFPIGYGMNAEQPQPVTTEPQVQEDAPADADLPVAARKRARVKSGQFAGDDPATEKNDAWAESSGTEA